MFFFHNTHVLINHNLFFPGYSKMQVKCCLRERSPNFRAQAVIVQARSSQERLEHIEKALVNHAAMHGTH